MRLLLYGINYAPEPVGIGKYSGELCEWLADRGHDIRVVTAQPYFPNWKVKRNCYSREERKGIRIWRCPLWVPSRPSGTNRILHLASFAMTSLPILIGQWSWKPEVIITVAPTMLCAPGAIIMKGLCGGETHSWLHIQDFEIDAAYSLEILKGSFVRWLANKAERRLINMFERVSTVSEAMQRHLVEKGISENRTTLLVNWVDHEKITPTDGEANTVNSYRAELGIGMDTNVVLYSGSMNQKQGFNIVVEAINKLRDVENLVWVFAGEGPGKKDLIKQTEGIRNVIFLPLQPVERLGEWLNLADVHVLPQRAEATDLLFPSKLLGMLASGKPIVGTALPGSELGEILEQSGCRANPGNANSLAREIKRLLDNAQLRDRKGKNARRIAINNFSKQVILREFEKELYGIVTIRTN